MDTNNIKKFATEARLKLRAGIEAKILTLGFDRKGQVQPQLMPQLMQGGTLWNGGIQPEGFYHQWMSLYRHVQQHGVSAVFEEAAYTWFNRLVAIRILQKNGIIAPVLAYADAARTPMIVHEARQGQLPVMENEMQRATLMQLLDDDTRTAEQFALLIVAYCHQCPVIRACFGSMADYTELLLPQNILSEGGFVDMLNHTEFITDEDFHSPELIGWLYQFYNAERKDEAFAKKGKYEADDIAPATQIFTPNWIVKYMVQNTVGRIYLDNNSYAEDMKARWKYLVEPAEPTPAEAVLHYDELTDLRVADLSCGSGHILNECFDMLYDLYIAEGYGRREAIEDIFRYNLTGVDLDTRAKQLATFALMLKACQKDASFADAHCLPRVLDMPEPFSSRFDLQDTLSHYFKGCEVGLKQQSVEAIRLMDDARTLGSIMIFDLSEENRSAIKERTEFWRNVDGEVPEPIRELLPYFEVILALTEKYHAVVMNPPYMGSGNMPTTLSDYVKDNYSEGKSDLCTVFMLLQMKRTARNGYYANIVPPSWMFLGSFENLRKEIISRNAISSMLHLSRGVFGADFGSVATVVQNRADKQAKGTYFRLIERTFQEFDQKHLKLLFEKTLANHDFRYFFADYTKEVEDIVYSEKGAKIYYPEVLQSQFERIPDIPIAYWGSEKMSDIWSRCGKNFIQYADARVGLDTGDNDNFMRLWHEINFLLIGFGRLSVDDFHKSNLLYAPHTKGGTYRKWYGNLEYVLKFDEENYNILLESGNHLPSRQFYFKEGACWSRISSDKFSLRYNGNGFVFNSAAPTLFSDSHNHLLYIQAYLSSLVSKSFLSLLSPTLNYQAGEIRRLPVIVKNEEVIDNIVENNISISKQDWDSHETSWDFAQNELISIAQNGESLEARVAQYEQKWEYLFMQLHANEEELNRQFIDIYGLQDELTPDVPLSEVTILQQGEINVSGDGISFNEDVIIKQFISYAIGCMMGRYRLDRPGLAIAHPDAKPEEYAPYTYHGETFEIDDDAIIPLMPADSGFSDNAAQRFSDFVRIALGDTCHIPNLNFVEKCLGKTVEQYFVKDFWKDHKKMYQNRPIYWLFASRKGAFQVITYMHRMNAYTVERIRAKYLLPYIEHLQQTVARLEARGAQLSTAESRRMEQLRKQLEECREYHERLQVVAEQAIAFDLDDGVVVNHAKFGDVVTKLK
jgi:hypothetical protein